MKINISVPQPEDPGPQVKISVRFDTIVPFEQFIADWDNPKFTGHTIKHLVTFFESFKDVTELTSWLWDHGAINSTMGASLDVEEVLPEASGE